MTELKTTKQTKKQITEKAKKIQKIPETIKKGITTITINNIHQTNETNNRTHIKKLLQPLINDEQLLELITLEENLQKIKTRFEYNAHLMQDQTKLGTLTHIGQKTPRETIQDLTQTIKQQMNWEEFYNNLPTLGQKGYSYQHQQKGHITTINLQITFKKAK